MSGRSDWSDSGSRRLPSPFRRSRGRGMGVVATEGPVPSPPVDRGLPDFARSLPGSPVSSPVRPTTQSSHPPPYVSQDLEHRNQDKGRRTGADHG